MAKNQKCRRADIESKTLRFGKNRGHPPVFAYVGERKELRAGRVDVGEIQGLPRKWRIENGPPSRKSIASAD
jgi:hypothetical protein